MRNQTYEVIHDDHLNSALQRMMQFHMPWVTQQFTATQGGSILLVSKLHGAGSRCVQAFQDRFIECYRSAPRRHGGHIPDDWWDGEEWSTTVEH